MDENELEVMVSTTVRRASERKSCLGAFPDAVSECAANAFLGFQNLDVNSRNGKELVGGRKLLERHNARGPGANAGDFHDAAVTS